MITYADAKLIAENTDGKLTADDVMNLVEYGTMNSQDMSPDTETKGLELTYEDMSRGY
tara:strand:+ start:1253 stop:1426 length:174 start_codon:yes stop_codon:yes gene_type:complete